MKILEHLTEQWSSALLLGPICICMWGWGLSTTLDNPFGFCKGRVGALKRDRGPIASATCQRLGGALVSAISAGMSYCF